MIEHCHLEDTVTDALANVAPAIAIAVFHQGEMILHNAWGWIDPDTCRYPVATETLFDLASLTKLFTTTAFLSLASEHNIKLDTPLIEIVPEFGHITPRLIDGGQDPHTKEHLPTPNDIAGQSVNPQDVTLWHLLTHTSGLPPWRDVYSVAPAPQSPTMNDNVSRSERWQMALHKLCNYSFVGHPVSFQKIGAHHTPCHDAPRTIC